MHPNTMYGSGMRSEALKGHLDMLLLAMLRESPAHGYLIARRLEQASAGVFELAEGTMYPALHRLERRGLIANETTVVEGRRRRVYTLTEAGREALAGELAEWRRFSNGVARTIEAI